MEPRSPATVSVTPSASPSRAATAPVQEPPEPCTQTVDDLELVVKPGPDVPVELTRDVRATTVRAHHALSSVPLPGCARRQTVVKIVTGFGAPNTAAQFQQVSTRRGVITLWTADWLDLLGVDRTLILVHEWWHQIQQLSGWCGADAGCRGGNLDAIPHWLYEADANLQALRVGQRFGLVSYGTEIDRWRGSTGSALLALRRNANPSTLPPEETFWWYKMAQFSGHDLVDGRPLAFLRFWRLAGKTGDWQRAFRLAFGVEYDAFFRNTFVHRERLWP